MLVVRKQVSGCSEIVRSRFSRTALKLSVSGTARRKGLKSEKSIIGKINM